jgi:sulfur-oxidizing protein SoxB
MVTNAGSNSKFLGVLDFEVKDKQGHAISATSCCPFLPTCCRPIADMQALITKIRAPYETQVGRKAGDHRGQLCTAVAISMAPVTSCWWMR